MSLPVLLGIVGIAAETAVWFELKRRAQTAADAAAVAGAIQRARGDKTNVIKSATRAATQNGFTTGQSSTTVTVSHPPISGAYVGQQDAVEVTVTRTFAPLISKLFHSANYTVHARAVAEVKVVGKSCILALSPTASNALYFQGSTWVNSDGCVVAANSSSTSAVAMAGNATLSAESVWSAGGFTTGNHPDQLTLATPAKTNMWALDDPYANLTVDSVGSCKSGFTNGANINGTVTLTPGRYCGGLSLSSKAKVTMTSGVYYFDAGSITIQGGATVTGSTDGVTMVLMNSSNAANPATIDIRGGATIDLRAPTSSAATYPGVLMFQKGTTTSSSTNKLNGGSNMLLRGAIYFPTQNVEFSGDNISTANTCIILVANQITFIGNSTIYNTGCDEAGVQPVRVKGVRLKE